ncbi:cyclic GMP-AMP synthase-like receptor 2 [Argopecten irradians]|uniref:cyclic GMP-AMP synthase-like receptor 2 n=1 Tax=Argopecten irradians TaxID=31199 RepID=UPI003720F3AD
MELFETKKAPRFLSQFLDLNIHIGSEEFVNVRRFLGMIDSTTDAELDYYNTMVHIGSRAEGFDFPKSDRDIMAVKNYVLVIQHPDEVLETDLSKNILVMDNTDCRPGYTLLTPLYERDHRRIRELVDINGKQYLSSTLFMHYTLMDGGYIHGPCSTFDLGISMDIAFAFHCRSWPDTLSDFISRTAHCVWPPSELVIKIVQDGFEIVAIGDKHSSLFEVQWRLSFVKAEVALVKSFNHVQFKTYGLLKIFLKECIERDDSVKDLLCSYFMKTILFHAIEHLQPTMWVDENIVECFWYCFTILLECVQTGFLPNYFILAHNLFLSNVIGDNRERLLRVLYGYQAMGWKCLFQCQTFHRLSIDIHQSIFEFPTPNRFKTRVIEINRDLQIAKQHGYEDIYKNVHLVTLAIGVLRTYDNDLFHYIAMVSNVHKQSFNEKFS